MSTVVYRLAEDADLTGGPVVISNQRGPVNNGDGTFTWHISLDYVRSTGLSDAEGARRIIALNLPGRVEPHQVEIVSLDGACPVCGQVVPS